MNDAVLGMTVGHPTNENGELEFRFRNKAGDILTLTAMDDKGSIHLSLWNSTKAEVVWTM